MTTRILVGSKQEIAEKVIALNGEVRQAIVFVEDPAVVAPPIGTSADEMFAEMEPHMATGGDFNDSRKGIHERLEEE